MSNKVKIYCPFCDQEYIVDRLHPGQKVECERCEKTFFINEDEMFDIEENDDSKSVHNDIPKERIKIIENKNINEYATKPSNSMFFKWFISLLVIAILVVLSFLTYSIVKVAKPLHELEKLATIDSKFETIDQKLFKSTAPIIAHKLFYFNWEHGGDGVIELAFETMIKAGWEPIGLVTLNGLKGSCYCFAKRGYSLNEIDKRILETKELSDLGKIIYKYGKVK